MNRPVYTKLNLEKTSSRPERLTTEHFLQILVPVDIMTTKRSVFRERSTKSTHSSIRDQPVLETNCKRSSENAIRENFNYKHDPQMKESFNLTTQILSPAQAKK